MMTPVQVPASNLGLYLYCMTFPTCVPAVAGLAEAGVLGVDERYPVTVLLASEAIVAVVGQVNISDFSETNLQNLSWLGKRAVQHEAVVAHMMAHATVLPVKFGSIFKTEASLKSFLNRHHLDMVQALDSLQDKTEWSVKGYLAEAQARQMIAAEDPDIQARRAALSTSPGVRYLQQKQLDARIETALQAYVTRVAQDLQQALQPYAEASIPLRHHASTVTGRPDRMVFNSSFLLTSDGLTEFREALSIQQNSLQKIGMSLALNGPWPAYNFCPALSDVTS